MHAIQCDTCGKVANSDVLEQVASGWLVVSEVEHFCSPSCLGRRYLQYVTREDLADSARVRDEALKVMQSDVTHVESPSAPAALPDEWLALDAGAQLAKVHPATVRRAIKAGRLRAVRINGGRVFRLRRSWIDQWLEGGGQ